MRQAGTPFTPGPTPADLVALGGLLEQTLDMVQQLLNTIAVASPSDLADLQRHAAEQARRLATMRDSVRAALSSGR